MLETKRRVEGHVKDDSAEEVGSRNCACSKRLILPHAPAYIDIEDAAISGDAVRAVDIEHASNHDREEVGGSTRENT